MLKKKEKSGRRHNMKVEGREEEKIIQDRGDDERNEEGVKQRGEDKTKDEKKGNEDRIEDQKQMRDEIRKIRNKRRKERSRRKKTCSVRQERGRETYLHISAALQFTDAGVKIQADAISILEL